jgi:hypothetical protein
MIFKKPTKHIINRQHPEIQAKCRFRIGFKID